MERRFVLFLVICVLIILGNTYVQRVFFPPPPRPAVPVVADKKEADPAAAKPQPKAADQGKPETAPKDAKPQEPKVAAAEPTADDQPEPALPEQLLTLGSLDAASPYRMVVTVTSRGAAVVRAELNDRKFLDLDDRYGYLGHLFVDESSSVGPAKVALVAPGTPAAEAGLRVGDVIKQLDGKSVESPRQFEELMKKTKPRGAVEMVVLRDGQQQTLLAKLQRKPLDVVSPENHDPLSFLMTLYAIDDQNLGDPERELVSANRELRGVSLRNSVWKIESATADQAEFVRELPRWGLRVSKTYRLEKVPEASQADRNFRAYHLTLSVSIRNIGDTARKVAYQLDGPTGLPKEGYWYASKVAGGLRDFVISLNRSAPRMIDSGTIAQDKWTTPWDGEPITYAGIDAQYFAAVMIPDKEVVGSLVKAYPLRVGKVEPDWDRVVNTSARLVSAGEELAAGAKPLEHSYVLFAGPKRPDLLEHYGLSTLVDYGWFDVIAIPMVKALHVFHAVVRNWGLAIIMLTVLVRLCMFPLSRKQTLGALKMQELQPEIKRLQEKHKGNVEARTKAQQELFRKHNYNPLSGCLPVFIQLPIFVALYRSLMVDIELRQAPLISESIRWCSNLASPDMLFDWSAYMPAFISSGAGMFGLGPYFNVLPIITIVLFLWQQKKMMPPPTDENAAMQQRVMKYMMVFMGILFYKVASGLCLYFIASTLWGMAERQFLPKVTHAAANGGGPSPAPPARPAGGRDGDASRGNKKSRRLR